MAAAQSNDRFDGSFEASAGARGSVGHNHFGHVRDVDTARRAANDGSCRRCLSRKSEPLQQPERRAQPQVKGPHASTMAREAERPIFV